MLLNEDNTELTRVLELQGSREELGYTTPGQELLGENMLGRSLDAGFSGVNPNPTKYFTQEYWDTHNTAKAYRELS